MKRFFLTLVAIVALVSQSSAQQTIYPTPHDYAENRFNFYVISDSGRNGYYEQKSCAETMGVMAESIGPEFIAAAGDTHHFMGVESTTDPLWITNYEAVYSHPELMIPWYAVCGNHEYRGNTQANIDYSAISRRWQMPSKYYSKLFEEDGVSLLVLFIDTPPLIDKYRNDTEKYPDAAQEDMQAQLKWIEKSLGESTADWKIVIGHHPIYAQTPKSKSERTNMQERVDPILRKYGVDAYVSGHIHNFQHIRMEGSEIDYIQNSAASLAREVSAVEGTLFCSPEEGFSIFSLDAKSLLVHFVDKNGRFIHTIERLKR
ncbi:MAG: metallophosphoesterase [Rikenellaceae bacterium]